MEGGVVALTDAQQLRTKQELEVNLGRSGLTMPDLESRLGLTAERLDAAMHLRPGAHPVDVWLLRDYLEQEILAQGGEPAPFTVLTPQARQVAAGWYRLRHAPGPAGQS